MTNTDFRDNRRQSSAEDEQSLRHDAENLPDVAKKVTNLPRPTLASVADRGRIRFGAGFRLKPRD